MSIEKKSLISTLRTTKKANVAAKPEAAVKADHTVSTRRITGSMRKLTGSTRKLTGSTRKLTGSTRRLVE